MDESQTMLNEKSQLLKDIYNDTTDVYFLKAGKINLHIVHKHLTRKTKNIHIFFARMLTSSAWEQELVWAAGQLCNIFPWKKQTY